MKTSLLSTVTASFLLLAIVEGCGGSRPVEPPKSVVDTQSEEKKEAREDGDAPKKKGSDADELPTNIEWQPGNAMVQAIGRVAGAAQRFEQQSSYGFDEDASCILGAYLEGGTEVAMTRPMRGGVGYMLIGGGSDSVQDLDLAIEDENGKMLKADALDDAAPVVGFTPPANGKYRIRLANAKSSGHGGFGVLAIMRDGGYSIPVPNFVRSFGHTIANAAQASKLISQRVKGTNGLVFHADGEWSFFGTILEQEEAIGTGGMDLGGPMSVIIAGADAQAEDVDISVLDTTTNKVVAKDDDEDAEPVVVLASEPGHVYKISASNMKSKGPSLVTMLVLDAEAE